MDPTQDLLANAGGNHLPNIPSLEQNGYRTRNRTATAVHNVGPEVQSDASLLRVKKASRVAQILTDSISKAGVLDGIGSTKNSFPSSNCEQYTLPEKEQIIKDSILSTPSMTSKRAKKFKPDEIKEAINLVSSQSSYPVNHISGSNISTESLTEHELHYKGANNASPILLRSSNNSPAVSHLSKTESVVSSDSSDYLLKCQKADSAKSPLDRKKRTSRMGIKSRMEGLNNVTDSAKALEFGDGCPDKVPNTPTPHALGKSSELQSGQKSVHAPRCVMIQPAEVPSEAQLDKLLAMNSESHDLQCPPRWSEGDLLWAKVSGHPFWPCMVSRCPFSKMYTRIKGDARIVRSYHVQFFGNEVERGWIAERSMIIFEGRLKFLDMSPSDSPRSMIGKGNPFKVNLTRRQAWNIAVEEAEGAATLSKEERNVQYTFDYIFMNDLKKEQQTSKLLDSSQVQVNDAATAHKPKGDAARKRSRSETNNMSPAANSNNKRRRLAFDSVEAEASFSEYYAKHRRLVMEQQPSLGTAFVFELLCQRWEAEKKAPPTSETPNSSSDVKSSIVLPDDSCGGEEGKSNTQLPKMLSEEVQVTDLAEPKAEEKTDVSRKRLRRSRNFSSVQEQGIKAVPSPSAVSGPTEDVPDLTRIVAKPALTTPIVMANKAKEKNTKRDEPYELEIYKLNSTCKIDKDNVCSLCEKNGALIECTGPCGQHFHASCVDLKSQQTVENYICAECTSGTHTCFACKNADNETVKCSVHSCGKYYHEDCIRKYRLSRIESKGFICPLHTCATCTVDNTKNPKAFKGRFYRCVRCPTAYHVGDFCIAAGSVNLAGSHMLCSDHFKPNKAMSCHSRLNITWCFSCSKGGTLLCCESCPAAFHAECVKVEKTPEEAWFCMDCSEGKKPLYGNIVWIKVGNYRWWPGEICHPRHVPMNIQEKAHQVGEFPVRFFGSHDYYWIHKGRVFLFQEGDKGSKEGSSRGLFKAYTKGIEEATDAFKLWTAAKAKKDEQEQERSEKKPAPYKYTKSNVPIGKVQIHKAELSELPRCDCKPDQEDACTTYCLNRLMMYECHPNSCPAGERCHNQRFQKRQYAGCEPFKSDTRGWGLRCLEDIKKGQFVLEYVGDVIDEMECKRRIEQAHEDNITNFYMLTMDKNRIIDAGPRGNFSRFLNHSCCPNMETQKWTVNGDIRVGLFALCDIPQGLELTFNYNLECLGNEKKACACGAENCSGFLGVRPKNAAANDKKTKEPKKKRRKKKLDIRNEYEDECFRCGEGGELVMCDKGNCPKVYHLKCLKLTKPPSGKWLCPWHHCDECGKMATVKCLDCPNSYCSSHTSDNIFKVDDVYICSDHNDILESLPNLPVNSFSSGVNAIRSEVGSKSSESSVANTAVGLKGSSVEGGDKPSTGAKSETLVVADVKQNKGISQVHASLVNTDHPLKIGQTDSQDIRPEGNGNAQKVLLPAAGISAGKSVIERNYTETSVIEKISTKKSVIEKNSAQNSVIERNSTEKSVIGRNSIEKSVIGRNSTEKSVIGRNLDVAGAINRRVAEPKLKVNSVNEQVDASSKSTRRIVRQPVKRIEATLCRTKARYKARLSPAGMASADVRTIAVNKPSSNHI